VPRATSADGIGAVVCTIVAPTTASAATSASIGSMRSGGAPTAAGVGCVCSPADGAQPMRPHYQRSLVSTSAKYFARPVQARTSLAAGGAKANVEQ
jgi:hypothetical protein